MNNEKRCCTCYHSLRMNTEHNAEPERNAQLWCTKELYLPTMPENSCEAWREQPSNPHNTMLLTSFTTWETKQRTNTSDTLVQSIEEQHFPGVEVLRQLPVAVEEAFVQVKGAIIAQRPRTVVLCGMTERRGGTLFLEARARKDVEKERFTHLPLTDIAKSISPTAISYDAGKFVCEGLYYETLKFVEVEFANTVNVVFIHVPRFRSRADAAMYTNALTQIIQHLQSLEP